MRARIIEYVLTGAALMLALFAAVKYGLFSEIFSVLMGDGFMWARYAIYAYLVVAVILIVIWVWAKTQYFD